MTKTKTKIDYHEPLKRAREILSDPARWTQNDYAKNGEKGIGQGLRDANPTSDCFCIMGAYGVAFIEQHPDRETLELGEVLDAIGQAADAFSYIDPIEEPFRSITGWNDFHERTHDEVLAKLDTLIEKTAP